MCHFGCDEYSLGSGGWVLSTEAIFRVGSGLWRQAVKYSENTNKSGSALRHGFAVLMTDRIRIIKHEAVPGCGSFEVRFADAMERWFVENDPEGVAFEYEVLD